MCGKELTLYQTTKISTKSKLKPFADNKIKMTQKSEFVLRRGVEMHEKYCDDYLCYCVAC